ncbi:UNVERIFIED_CONTAM: hypothetical protein K2H54_040725 [Gekko kuhli]
MAPTIFLLIVSVLLFASPSHARRKRSPLESPIDKISPRADFDPSQFTGKWHLVAVASECAYLRDSYRKADGVSMVISMNETTPQSPMWVSTFYPLRGECFHIKQMYSPTRTPGRYLLTGRGLPVDVVVGETDYSSYAIIFYQKSQKITVKIYGRTRQLSDSITDKFDQIVADVGLNEDLTFYFRAYGFCQKADQFHTLDETITMDTSGSL